MSARPVDPPGGQPGSIGRHPRRWQYARAATGRPTCSTSRTSSSASRRAASFASIAIRAAALAFDTRIRPNFEDAHFAVRYLLDLPRPVVGLLRDARVRLSQASGRELALQGSMRHPGRYAEVLELGYLDCIERGRQPDGSIPEWIQQLIVYELSWYLSGDERISTTVRVPRRAGAAVPRAARPDPSDARSGGRRPGTEPGRWTRCGSTCSRMRGRGLDWHSPDVVRVPARPGDAPPPVPATGSWAGRRPRRSGPAARRSVPRSRRRWPIATSGGTSSGSGSCGCRTRPTWR